MYPAFAYSREMQFILALVTFTETFCSMYVLSNLILTTYGLSAKRSQRFLFAVITGTLMQNVLIYGVYFLRGMVSFSPLMFSLITTPNPINGFLYYLIAQKVFKLSPVRSVKVVSYVYLFWITMQTLNWLNNAFFFPQNDPQYNYLKDAIQQVCYFIVFFIMCTLAQHWIKRNHVSLRFVDNLFFNQKRELILFFSQATIAYAIRVTMPLFIPNPATALAITAGFLILIIIINLCVDIIAYSHQTISNDEVHISALFKGMEELRGIKHDFNNILHTYSGYLELKEYDQLQQYHASLVSATSHAGTIMDLAEKMQENPPLITLLVNKLDYAEMMNVKLFLSLNSDLSNFYVENMDVSRILSILLDNAIEAASESVQRKVYLSIESKSPISKLIIISNSTAAPINLDDVLAGGDSGNVGQGVGLSVVRNLVKKYANCSFQLKHFDYEFSAYLELKAV